MANFSVTTYGTDRQNNAAAALQALETHLDGVDRGKTIYLKKVICEGHSYVGALIYET